MIFDAVPTSTPDSTAPDTPSGTLEAPGLKNNMPSPTVNTKEALLDVMAMFGASSPTSDYSDALLAANTLKNASLGASSAAPAAAATPAAESQFMIFDENAPSSTPGPSQPAPEPVATPANGPGGFAIFDESAPPAPTPSGGGLGGFTIFDDSALDSVTPISRVNDTRFGRSIMEQVDPVTEAREAYAQKWLRSHCPEGGSVMFCGADADPELERLVDNEGDLVADRIVISLGPGSSDYRVDRVLGGSPRGGWVFAVEAENETANLSWHGDELVVGAALKYASSETLGWESYLLNQIEARTLPAIPHVPRVRATYFYGSSGSVKATAVLHTRASSLTLRDVLDVYKGAGITMPEPLAVYYGLQVLDAVGILLASSVAHLHISPSKFLLRIPEMTPTSPWTPELEGDDEWDRTGLMLVDFASGLDILLPDLQGPVDDNPMSTDLASAAAVLAAMVDFGGSADKIWMGVVASLADAPGSITIEDGLRIVGDARSSLVSLFNSKPSWRMALSGHMVEQDGLLYA